MNSAADGIEMRLIASGFVRGEWTATEIAQVIAPEVETLRGQTEAMMSIIERDTAAIQRVREVLYTSGFDRDEKGRQYGYNEWSAGWVACANDIRRALDGGAE